jgi:hypothetical protein
MKIYYREMNAAALAPSLLVFLLCVGGGYVDVSGIYWLNMELDLQNLFGILCTAVLIG